MEDENININSPFDNENEKGENNDNDSKDIEDEEEESIIFEKTDEEKDEENLKNEKVDNEGADSEESSKELNFLGEGKIISRINPQELNLDSLLEMNKVDLKEKEEGNNFLSKCDVHINISNIKMNKFIDDNVSFFSTDIRNKLVPVFIVSGEESSGKSSLINSTVGAPICFTKTGTATRCVICYYISASEKGIEKEFENINKKKEKSKKSKKKNSYTESDSDESISDNNNNNSFETPKRQNKQKTFNANITPPNGLGLDEKSDLDIRETYVEIANIMEEIEKKEVGGISNEIGRCSLEIDDKATLNHIVIDFPGTQGNSKSEKENILYRESVKRLCKKITKERVLPSSSKSWLFVVVPFGERLENKNFLDFLDNNKKFDRVAIIFTKVDRINTKSIFEDIKSSGKEVGDESLYNFFTSSTRELLPNGKIFLVCNAQGLTDGVHNNEKKFANELKNVMKAIKDEQFQTMESRSFEFLQKLDELRKGNDYITNKNYWNKILEIFGVSKLRSFIKERAISGVDNLIDFIRSTLNSAEQNLVSSAKEIQEQYKSLGIKNVDSQLGMLKSVIECGRDIFYYLMTGKSLPVSRDVKNTTSRPPTRFDWKEIKNKRCVKPSEDSSFKYEFPNGLDKETQNYIKKKFIASDLPIFTLKGRLMNMYQQFIGRLLLITPKKLTKEEISIGTNDEDAIERRTITSLIETEVQQFIESIKTEASTFLEKMSDDVIEHGIETVIVGLKSTIHASLMENPKIVADIKSFFRIEWKKSFVDEIRLACEQAASVVETPIVPQVPGLLEIAVEMLPRSEKYQKKWSKQRKDLTHLVNDGFSLTSKLLLSSLNNSNHFSKIANTIKEKFMGEKNDKGETVPKVDKTMDTEKWERLERPQDKMLLVDILSTTLFTTENPFNPLANSQINDIHNKEVERVNQILLKQIKTVLVLFCFQMQLLLPKTYRPYTIAPFLDNGIEERFIKYFLSLYDKPEEEIEEKSTYDDSLFILSDGKVNEKEKKTKEEMEELIKKVYNLESYGENLQKRMSTLFTLKQKYQKAKENVDSFKNFLTTNNGVVKRILENNVNLL